MLSSTIFLLIAGSSATENATSNGVRKIISIKHTHTSINGDVKNDTYEIEEEERPLDLTSFNLESGSKSLFDNFGSLLGKNDTFFNFGRLKGLFSQGPSLFDIFSKSSAKSGERPEITGQQELENSEIAAESATVNKTEKLEELNS